MVVVIFDWDGTLANSMPNVLDEFGRFALEIFNLEPQMVKNIMLEHLGERLPAHIQRTAKIANQKLSENELSELVEKCAERFIKRIIASPLFPEVKNVMKKLKRKGYKLIISSGMMKEPLINAVKRQRLEKYFCLILGTVKDFYKGKAHFDFISKKYNVKPQQMVFVGDGPFDMMVGKEYGCFTVGRVDQIDAEALLKAGADAVIINLLELPEVIDEQFSGK